MSMMKHRDQVEALLRKQIGNETEVADIFKTAGEVARKWVNPSLAGNVVSCWSCGTRKIGGSRCSMRRRRRRKPSSFSWRGRRTFGRVFGFRWTSRG